MPLGKAERLSYRRVVFTAWLHTLWHQVAPVSEGRLPRVTVAEVQRALLRAGWRLKREGGNHQILTHQARGGRVVIPRHATHTLKPKTLRSILDQAGLTVDDFRHLL